MEATLKDPKLHSNLGALQSCSPHLALAGGKRIVISGGPFSNVAEFDKCLMGTLNLLSTGLLLANTNVTYPMKSLLLLTGLMPAFDSQVRNGLAVAGVSGINNTQYLLPALGSTNAKKICAIPFYISDCVSRQAGIINTETSASMYPSLATEHGRVFDVLLFMQSDRTHLTVTFSPGATKRWYAI